MNTELKQYVAAGYIGQYVLRFIDQKTIYELNLAWYPVIGAENSYLLLRPLSAITDSEAVEVAKIMRLFEPYIDSSGSDGIILKQGNQFTCQIYFDAEIYCDVGGLTTEWFSVYQYLQQQGFALPVWFKGEFYSVERLVNEEKIIKLTE